MECRWSLKELYDSFESASFKEDMTKLEDYVDSLNKFGEKIK